MAGPIPMDYLQPDERPLIVEGRHPLSLLDGLFGLTLLVLVLVAGVVVLWVLLGPALALPLLVSVVVLYLWGALLLYWRVKTSRYTITADRVYRSHGRLRFRLLQTTYDKVTDLHVRQSLFGRWWDFGDVTVQTAGTGLTMEGVRRPDRMKRHLEEARTAFLDRLIEEHRLDLEERPSTRGAASAEDTEAATWRAPQDGAEDASEATAPPARSSRREPQVLWKGRPVFVSLVSGLFSAVALVLVALTFGGTALATEAWIMLALAGFMIVMGALVGLNVWVQYRFTRYEVADWGVVVTSGWLTRKRVEATYAKVTDVTTYQGIMGRLFDFGNITINTAGSNQAPIMFNGLSKPETVKATIDEARQAAQGRRRVR